MKNRLCSYLLLLTLCALATAAFAQPVQPRRISSGEISIDKVGPTPSLSSREKNNIAQQVNAAVDAAQKEAAPKEMAPRPEGRKQYTRQPIVYRDPEGRNSFTLPPLSYDEPEVLVPEEDVPAMPLPGYKRTMWETHWEHHRLMSQRRGIVDAQKDALREAKIIGYIRIAPTLTGLGVDTEKLFNTAVEYFLKYRTYFPEISQHRPSGQLYEELDARLDDQEDRTSLDRVNPFTLPGVEEARIVLLGEVHTLQYPAEKMVAYLLKYNRTAPENKKIKFLFLEYAFQLNYAMEYVYLHLNEMAEPELLRQAIAYSKEKMGEDYVEDPEPRNSMHWLHLGYLLAKSGSGVKVYAYDWPAKLEQRNRLARACMQSFYDNETGKAVFIGGAVHMLRSNIPAEPFNAVNSDESLANTASIPSKEIISIFMLGGQEWKNSSYGNDNPRYIQTILDKYQGVPGNWALKTDPNSLGFDYFFMFDQQKEPEVARISR
ncbi:MAG: hypothetical protein J6V32_06690 [Elusimicrobiaceae bacterium]|nr:hypothetical protein [Elusimicrobiaceae bacterium]